METEQMELLERLARLRDLGAISRREFRREKEAVLRAPPRSAVAAVHLRALPAPGAAAGAVAMPLPASSAPPATPRPRPVRSLPEATLLQRAGCVTGWILWTLFSIGGLDALLDHDALQSLSLLLCGLLFAPPLHRLLAMRMALPTRVAITLLGLIAVLGMGAGPRGQAAGAVPAVRSEAAAACGKVVSGTVEDRSVRAREGIVRPWRKVWSDLLWARVAGRSAIDEWRQARS